MSRTRHREDGRATERETRRELLRAGIGISMAFSGCLGSGGKSSSTNGHSKVRRRRYAVTVDGRRERLTLDVPTAAYKRAQEQPRSLSRAIASARSSELLHQLGRQIAAGYETNSEQLLAAQAAVASIPYATDTASTGTGEYVRYPVETLTEQTGDCEDVAVLLAGLLESPALGFQSGLVVTESHCAALVATEEIDSSIVAADALGLTLSGTDYIYLEATDRSPPGSRGGSNREQPLLAAYLHHWYLLDMPALRDALAEAVKTEEVDYAWQFIR